jgi:lipopolysaccharide biosynthesis glycosyltransferase
MPVPVKGGRIIWIGFDPREGEAYAVARASIRQHLKIPIPVRGLVLDNLKTTGLYTRPTSRHLGQLYDEISEHTMATEFAISRFLVPHLSQYGWALFMDCDMLVRDDLGKLFEIAENNPQAAIMCVKHNYDPTEVRKMDNQVQSRYARKNWSSVCMFNCDHPTNKALTVEYVNSKPGRDLHRFCWVPDEQIIGLDEAYNWIPGHSPSDINPKIVHFSEGGPWFTGYENIAYADEWRHHLHKWAA